MHGNSNIKNFTNYVPSFPLCPHTFHLHNFSFVFFYYNIHYRRMPIRSNKYSLKGFKKKGLMMA